MSGPGGDRLSARVRIIEALEHLDRAKRTLAEEDDDLADALDDVIGQVDAISDALATSDGSSSDRTTSDEAATCGTANRRRN